MKFVKRLAILKKSKSFCLDSQACPDIWELEDGVAVIGEDITKTAKPILPKGVALGVNEKIIRIPRQLLKSAMPNI